MSLDDPMGRLIADIVAANRVPLEDIRARQLRAEIGREEHDTRTRDLRHAKG